MRFTASLFNLSLVATTFAFGQTEFLPPAPAWQGASEALIAKPDNPWITPSEKTGLTDSPNYDETIAWLRKLDAASPLIEMRAFGQTPEGRTLYLVIASNGDATAARVKPSLLAQAGIHSGEIDGKDAGMMLLRDIAFGGKASLVDEVNLLFVPVFNADGHERSSAWNRPNQRGPVHQGWRTSAQNLNLNRDYAKADAREMIAMLRLINQWQPALYLDLHVTDGIDYQYDITYTFHGWDGSFAWSPKSGAWLDKTWRPAMDAALKSAGHIPGPYIAAVNNRDLTEGISMGAANPRFSNSYGDLRHVPSVLVENHSLKPYKQRVLGTYVLLEASLKTLAAHGPALTSAIAADSQARPATVAMNWSGNSDEHRKMDFLGIAYDEYVSPASGIKEVRWLGTPKTYQDLIVHWNTKPGVELRRPKSFWVPASKPEVIARLERHGIQFERIAHPVTKSVEQSRLVGAKAAAQPFESRHLLNVGKVTRENGSVTFLAGSVRVPTDQPLGDLAIALLDPESADSLLAWGFFPEILQRTEYIEGYIVAPMAEKMLASDATLKAEFEAKLAGDAEFAKNADARLQWFYERTKFYDERYLLYPVGIER
ncbi:M14 family metallopeptidase [Oleiharenicola lentus]|uniref:M14 family metallopeptidase n=1 Tax=Oleiharenicola lentus TaxID=2508720 RepID=UPI003F67D4ED